MSCVTVIRFDDPVTEVTEDAVEEAEQNSVGFILTGIGLEEVGDKLYYHLSA